MVSLLTTRTSTRSRQIIVAVLIASSEMSAISCENKFCSLLVKRKLCKIAVQLFLLTNDIQRLK